MFRIGKSRQLDRRPSIPSEEYFYVTGYLSSPVSKGQPAKRIYSGNQTRTSTVLQILKANDEFITFEILNSTYITSYLEIFAENHVLCAQRYGNQKMALLKRRCP